MRSKIYPFVTEALSTIEPIVDDSYGPIYRCSATLEDGTFLPCVTLQSRDAIAHLARLRITEALQGRSKFRSDDPFGEMVAHFAASGTQVSDYKIRSIGPSRFAIPLSLMQQIHGETTMAWTGWVFRMRDGRCFSYGSPFRWDFLDLPDDYEFSDVAEVINHSYVDLDGQVKPLRQGSFLPEGYADIHVMRERIHFVCYVDGIEAPQMENPPNLSSSFRIVAASAFANAKRRWFSWPSPK
ncbi:hypothetical protein [Rhizobium alvei]|uniref:Uncharacterized protein n=1 Tax=Rhizobium alvei TaxID=1132659 RepID=A0ABT8YS15_9HYPH|nr:hypothetical protein [Rhizobium alvei]MDO6966544.1 hypothetical protein [Rhizobium alvei]